MAEQVKSWETVSVSSDGGVWTIELNRPDALNAWNAQLDRDLLAAVELVAGEEAARAVVLRGAGRGFSSGADLKETLEEGAANQGVPDVRRKLNERCHPIITGVREMPKPVIAAVHGPAAGIGLSLALAADLVLAAESAYFLLAFVNIGLAPDGGASILVPSRIGMARAAEMAMLGERIDARKALDWGLINAVHPDGELDAAVAALAQRLAGGPTRAYAVVKRQLNASLFAGMPQQLELEAELQQELATSADFLDGVAAFVERRPARFTGA